MAIYADYINGLFVGGGVLDLKFTPPHPTELGYIPNWLDLQ